MLRNVLLRTADPSVAPLLGMTGLFVGSVTREDVLSMNRPNSRQVIPSERSDEGSAVLPKSHHAATFRPNSHPVILSEVEGSAFHQKESAAPYLFCLLTPISFRPVLPLPPRQFHDGTIHLTEGGGASAKLEPISVGYSGNTGANSKKGGEA